MNKRKIITVIMATCFMVIGLGGCGSTDNSIENTAPQNSTITNDQSAEADKAEERILICDHRRTVSLWCRGVCQAGVHGIYVW